jgi:hypothetical protein
MKQLALKCSNIVAIFYLFVNHKININSINYNKLKFCSDKTDENNLFYTKDGCHNSSG